MKVTSKEQSMRLREAKEKIRLKNKDSTNIPYPDANSEVEVLIFIYNDLIKNGVDVRCEVTSKDRSCRFDLVIFNDKVAQRIIEVKRGKKTVAKMAQRDKYNKYQIPVDVVKGIANARLYVQRIYKVISDVRFIDNKEAPKVDKKIKILEEGQACRRCQEPVIKRDYSGKLKDGQKYFYRFYLLCPKCKTQYMLESQKVYV